MIGSILRRLAILVALSILTSCGDRTTPVTTAQPEFTPGVYEASPDTDPPLPLILRVMPGGTFEICGPPDERGEFCYFGIWRYTAPKLRLHKRTMGTKGEELLDMPDGGKIEEWIWRDGGLYTPHGDRYTRPSQGD